MSLLSSSRIFSLSTCGILNNLAVSAVFFTLRAINLPLLRLVPLSLPLPFLSPFTFTWGTKRREQGKEKGTGMSVNPKGSSRPFHPLWLPFFFSGIHPSRGLNTYSATLRRKNEWKRERKTWKKDSSIVVGGASAMRGLLSAGIG